MSKCENIPTGISLCLTTLLSQQGGISVFKFPKKFLEFSWAKISLYWPFLTLLALLTQPKHLKNPLPTSFSLCHDDHLGSSAKNSHCLSDPTTLKTPPGDYKTQNFSQEDFIYELASNAAHVDCNLFLCFDWTSIWFTTQGQRLFPTRLKRNATCNRNAMDWSSKLYMNPLKSETNDRSTFK